MDGESALDAITTDIYLEQKCKGKEYPELARGLPNGGDVSLPTDEEMKDIDKMCYHQSFTERCTPHYATLQKVLSEEGEIADSDDLFASKECLDLVAEIN